MASGPEAGASSARTTSTDPRMQQLEGALERARRANRPLVLNRLPTAPAREPHTLDPKLLGCLRYEGAVGGLGPCTPWSLSCWAACGMEGRWGGLGPCIGGRG